MSAVLRLRQLLLRLVDNFEIFWSLQITISGTRCAELGVFIAPEINHDGEVIHGTTTFCAVEEYALSYYRQEGFDQGIHGEGSTYSSLYCLFVWDIIFSSGIPDVFRSPFQVR